jgi:uncharacterized protein YgbK (DUF1537 family)
LTYYGDDFTGSTDVLEALHSGGIEAVLFATPPSDQMLRRYASVRAFGIAGDSRTMSPQDMEMTLPDVFRSLQSRKSRIVHYKVCSTFDSSPEVGSVGRAIDIGHRIFQNRVVPVVVGAPSLGRYCVFGNLFARSGLNSIPYRLDRHPTMQRHPVTPMTEADLRVLLSRQTSRPVDLIDVIALDNGYDTLCNRLGRVETYGTVVLLDALTDKHLETVGRLIDDVQQREQKPIFVAGSSGIDYALVKYWQAAGIAPGRDSSPQLAAPIPAVEQTVILSGSCSPVTDRQIGWALEHGFAEVAVDAPRLQRSTRLDFDIRDVTKHILSSLDSGRSVIVHTSRGPCDTRIATMNRETDLSYNHDRKLGAILGRIMREVLRSRPIRRVAVVGGDTAGQVARSLGVEAVEMIGPLEPGAPLCAVRSRDEAVDGIEMVFKGGQVGFDDFFAAVLRGRSSHVTEGETL